MLFLVDPPQIWNGFRVWCERSHSTNKTYAFCLCWTESLQRPKKWKCGSNSWKWIKLNPYLTFVRAQEGVTFLTEAKNYQKRSSGISFLRNPMRQAEFHQRRRVGVSWDYMRRNVQKDKHRGDVCSLDWFAMGWRKTTITSWQWTGTHVWFFRLFRRAVLAVAAIGAMSCESSGKASARGLMSPTTGVAWRRASAACCSLACLMELISEDNSSALGYSIWQ